MEASVFSCSSAGATEGIIRALTSRGWCFGDVALVKGLISIQSALHGDSCTVDLIESVLANTDLRSIGGESLSDASLLRNSSHLPGPKVLQVVSVRDISRSSIDDNSGTSRKRLLRLILTDGHSEIIAIEYSHVRSISSDIVPGTKVRLENKAPIHCGIVCLSPKAITLLGGVVQSLYEEWQMNQKYSGFSRSSLKISKESDAESGPPPFEKLEISSLSCPAIQARVNHECQSKPPPKYSGFSRSSLKISKESDAESGPPPFEKLEISSLSRPAIQARVNQQFASTSKSYKPTYHGKDPRSDQNPIIKHHEHGPNVDNVLHNRNAVSNAEKSDGSASNSEGRAKEAVEFVPVQNQAAAQKLLQKMSQPNREYHSRGRKYRGKGREEDELVFTLDEWEKRKAESNPSLGYSFPNVSEDEDLARQLQDQFDLEDYHGPGDSEAERLRKSMFHFQRNDERGYDGERFRGRGRGRGRRRGRSRGH